MAQVLVDMFNERHPALPYADEIEDLLAAIMEDEFNTEVQDGSLGHVRSRPVNHLRGARGRVASGFPPSRRVSHLLNGRASLPHRLLSS